MSKITASSLVHNQTARSVFFLFIGAIMLYTLIATASLKREIATLRADIASTTIALSYTADILSKNFNELSRETAGLSGDLAVTRETINTVSTKVGGVENTVGSISGTVSTLQKLSEIEKEILKKYSKVYFMNENYTPEHLTVIPEEYLYSTKKQEHFLSEAWPKLKALLDDAKKAGVEVYIKSAYRSFAEQKSIKSSYSVLYGAGTANAFSADQGYSEHQLGSTVDLVTTGMSGQLTTSFDTTQAFLWLKENAHRYGFILSYPKGNAYYIYEPWHWRYVGVKLATYLYENKMNFYDLDQREIDQYLLTVFE